MIHKDTPNEQKKSSALVIAVVVIVVIILAVLLGVGVWYIRRRKIVSSLNVSTCVVIFRLI